MAVSKSYKLRQRRRVRIRSKISGTPECPRLAVFKSNLHIYAQIIDDSRGITLASASSLEKGFRSAKENANLNVDVSKKVGTNLAKRAKDNGISRVVFDRGGNLYHGNIKVLADSAREAGLQF